MTRSPHIRATQTGGSLVEVMIAVLVLAVLAIGGVSFMYRSGAGLAVQRNRMGALAVVTGRLEEIRATRWSALAAMVPHDYGEHAIRHPAGASGTNWVPGSGETIAVNGHVMAIDTTLQFMDVDGGASSYDVLKVTAAVQYRMGSADWVTCRTIYAQ